MVARLQLLRRDLLLRRWCRRRLTLSPRRPSLRGRGVAPVTTPRRTLPACDMGPEPPPSPSRSCSAGCAASAPFVSGRSGWVPTSPCALAGARAPGLFGPRRSRAGGGSGSRRGTVAFIAARRSGVRTAACASCVGALRLLAASTWRVRRGAPAPGRPRRRSGFPLTRRAVSRPSTGKATSVDWPSSARPRSRPHEPSRRAGSAVSRCLTPRAGARSTGSTSTCPSRRSGGSPRPWADCLCLGTSSGLFRLFHGGRCDCGRAVRVDAYTQPRD